jgi:hypothetical protein
MMDTLRMPRRVALILTALTAMALCAYLVLSHSPSAEGITLENFNKIDEGMDEQQVERILGIAAGDCSNGELYGIGIVSANICFYCPPEQLRASTKRWSSDKAEVTVWFDDRSGGVVGKSFHHPIRIARPTLWQRFLVWLGF